MLLIGISGKKRTGKDTVAAIMQKQIKLSTKVLGFADPLKEEVSKACGVTLDYIEEHKVEFRPILQWWGTDFRRKLQDKHYWIKKAREAAQQSECDVVIFKDVRFVNEADFIKYNDGFIIRVRRKVDGIDEHISETELDAYKPDFYIDNDSSLEDLRRRVKDVLHQIKQAVNQGK